MEAVEKTIILQVTQEHQKGLQNYILKNVKEIRAIEQDKESIEGEDNTNRGAYGNLIDLEWNGSEYAGKVLHSIFFSPGTEPSGIRQNSMTK